MHELGITESILQIALEHAEKAGAKQVRRIHLVVGELSSIADESVQFYFDFFSKDTAAEGAQLVFQKLAARFRCPSCGQEFGSQDGDWTCPRCQAPGHKILAGREFYMESIEVE
jgi:hydrogenase nickel incorporation protein HypA/HybF